MRVIAAALIAMHTCEVAAHGHLLTPDFRRRVAVGSQINGYYVYWPYAEFAPTCIQGHCFGATSFRCKDMAAEVPSTTLHAGSNLTLSIWFQAWHPGDCSVYLSYDENNKDAPSTWLVLGHYPGCAGGGDRTLSDGTTLSFNVSLPPWLASCAHCVLRWEWSAVHQPGRPQQYLDCADVKVAGQSSALTAETMLRSVRPLVSIIDGAEHLRGNGHTRYPYSSGPNHQREFGLRYMAGGEAEPGGSVAVASWVGPSLSPPPPPPPLPPPPPPGVPSTALPSRFCHLGSWSRTQLDWSTSFGFSPQHPYCEACMPCSAYCPGCED